MQQNELRPLDILDSVGGQLLIVDRETGEVIGGVIVPSGRHMVRTFVRELPSGCFFQPDENISVTRRRSVGVITDKLDQAESSANPIWHPSPMTRQEKMLRDRLKRFDVLERRMKMQTRALERAEATSQATLAARLAEVNAAKAETEALVEEVHQKAEDKAAAAANAGATA